MIHFKSTLAASAIILGGLVAASPYPYPSAGEADPPRVAARTQTALSSDARAETWSDPPRHQLTRIEAPTLPPETVVASAAPEPAIVAQPARLAAAEPQRRKSAQAASRKRQLASKQTAPAQAIPAEAAPGPVAASPPRPFDPITGLLRGLGIGT